MCLMLYLGSHKSLPLRGNPSLTLEAIPETAQGVRQQVRTEFVYFIGSHSGCSCGFPHVCSEQAVEYYDGLFDEESPERALDIASVRELLLVIDEALAGQPDCVLFPVWTDAAGAAPKGEIRWNRTQLCPERFLLNEQFRYTIFAEQDAPTPIGQPDR